MACEEPNRAWQEISSSQTMILFVLLFSLAAAFAASGQAPSISSSVSSTQQVFQVKGVIKDIHADGKTVKIRHEAITNYMPAMTMDFEVKNTNELRGLKSNDVVAFQMVVNEKEGWIEKIQKLNSSPTETPSRATFRVVRDVVPLKTGDLLPDYHFTNELGRRVNLGDYKGQAIAFT